MEQESIKVDDWDLPHFYRFVHIHPEFQMTLIERSRGTLFYGGNAHMFENGDIFLIGPNVPHVFMDISSEDNRENIKATSIFFPKEYADKIFHNIKEAESIINLLRDSACCSKVGKASSSTIANSILQMKTLSTGFPRILKLMQILYEMSLDYEQLSIESNPENVNNGSRIERIIDYTLKNYHRKIELKEVAELTNMTETAFCRFFKQSTSKSYMQLLLEIRIGMACRFMVSNNYNLADIAYMVGFNSISNFVKQFKKIMNTTPSEYRKRISIDKLQKNIKNENC